MFQSEQEHQRECYLNRNEDRRQCISDDRSRSDSTNDLKRVNLLSYGSADPFHTG